MRCTKVAARLLSVGLALTSTSCAEGNSGNFDYETSQLPILNTSEKIRIGSIADPDAGFSNVGAVTVDSDGNIYAIERQDGEIRVFDQEGVRIGTIGRAGEGPGEFSRPDRLGFRGDTLWVNDPALGRITMFSRDGDVLKTFPALRSVRLESPSPSVMAMALGGALRSDGLVHMEQLSAVVLLGRGEPPPDSLVVPILRVDRTATVRDTAGSSVLYLIPSDDEGSPGRPAQTDMLLDPGPSSDSPLRVQLDDGFVVVDRAAPSTPEPTTFSVTRVSSRDTIYSVRLRFQPHRFEGAPADSLLSVSPVADVPTYQPPVTAAMAGDDNSLWLRREIERSPFATWLLLAADGTPRGHVRLPIAASPRWVSEDLVYAVERDQNDVPWLVGYRIDA